MTKSFNSRRPAKCALAVLAAAVCCGAANTAVGIFPVSHSVNQATVRAASAAMVPTASLAEGNPWG